MKNENTGAGTPNTDAAAAVERPAKQVWQTPSIEEVDYAETQSNFAHPGGIDFGLYS